MRINIFGCPGSGKSKLAADVFSYLKENHIPCELSLEVIKDYAYQEIPIEGYINLDAVVQHLKKEHMLLTKAKVKAVITDSPVVLGLFYAKHFKALGYRGLEAIIVEHEKLFPSINIMLRQNTTFPYDTKGRYQTKQESSDLQYKIFAEVSTFYSTYMKKAYNVKSLTAGDSEQQKDLLTYIKEVLK